MTKERFIRNEVKKMSKEIRSEIQNPDNNDDVPGFDKLPPLNLIRGWWASGAAFPPNNKPLDEAFDEALANMSREEKDAFNERLREISEMFGSGGP